MLGCGLADTEIIKAQKFTERQAKEPLAQVSFSPSFSLGVQSGPRLRNRFNGLRVSSHPTGVNSGLPGIRLEPQLDPLRPDTRFQELLNKVGFPR